jgi:hypothetical protein
MTYVQLLNKQVKEIEEFDKLYDREWQKLIERHVEMKGAFGLAEENVPPEILQQIEAEKKDFLSQWGKEGKLRQEMAQKHERQRSATLGYSYDRDKDLDKDK